MAGAKISRCDGNRQMCSHIMSGLGTGTPFLLPLIIQSPPIFNPRERRLFAYYFSFWRSVLKLCVSENKKKKEPYWNLSRDVLPAPINADVDLFVLLRNLHLWPVWSLHVYLKSHLIGKDTAIRLESESLLGSLVLPPELFLWSVLPNQTNHFHTNWILVTETQDFSSGISSQGLSPAPFLCVMGAAVFQADRHLSFPRCVPFFPPYLEVVSKGKE